MNISKIIFLLFFGALLLLFILSMRAVYQALTIDNDTPEYKAGYMDGIAGNSTTISEISIISNENRRFREYRDGYEVGQKKARIDNGTRLLDARTRNVSRSMSS